MIPIPQLFHTRMTHVRQVYTVHWGAEGKDALGIIHETKYELRRKSIDEKTKDIYECERLLEIIVAAKVLSMACINCVPKSLEELSKYLQDWESLDRLLGKITDILSEQALHTEGSATRILRQTSIIDAVLPAIFFTLNGSAISWRAKQQDLVTLSTVEAEYVGMTEACKESVWLQRMLNELSKNTVSKQLLLKDVQH